VTGVQTCALPISEKAQRGVVVHRQKSCTASFGKSRTCAFPNDVIRTVSRCVRPTRGPRWRDRRRAGVYTRSIEARRRRRRRRYRAASARRSPRRTRRAANRAAWYPCKADVAGVTSRFSSRRAEQIATMQYAEQSNIEGRPLGPSADIT